MKKVLALMLSLAMVLAMAACSVEKDPDNTTPANTDGTEGSPTASQVEIEWWAFPTFGNATGYEEELIAAFNEICLLYTSVSSMLGLTSRDTMEATVWAC